MSLRARWLLFTLACLCLAPSTYRLVASMPSFGRASSAYGDAVNALGPARRHVSNMVALVNFDVRALDTLGEESMLLCAVAGAVLLLRGRRGEDLTEKAERREGRAQADRADSTVIVCRIMATAVLLFGVYVVLHGTVTPGGGFQGGVIAASGLVLVYLADGYSTWRKVALSSVLAPLEGGGAFIFTLAAIAPMAMGRSALENVLPLGSFKDLFSGGMMVLFNAAVGLAVFGGFSLLALEFMEETRSPKNDPVPDEED